MALILVLDPGHGGKDPGASGNGLVEKNLALDITKRVRTALSSHQVDVKLTRESDVDLSLADRVAYANNLNAGYFLSIHVNAGGGTGFESYVWTGAGGETESLRRAVHMEVSAFYKSAGFPDRGEKKADFYVLRNTKMSAALLENLFVDNKTDAAKLADAGFREEIAKAIAAGLVSALKIQPAAWDPAAEIEKLRADGLINSPHQPLDPVNWGEFATVINRLRGK
ncbi:MAG: N-acetylmuramoyl-L-alanine amidase [Peptococcaceae bacterium]|jgi:N-acetylmuramoyl-L-alanine amidase|nr:MAG: N-acetylmuramoyl-L-alanine amidase [Peptococcaceae bacterium]